jgi:hypothetical protein
LHITNKLDRKGGVLVVVFVLVLLLFVIGVICVQGFILSNFKSVITKILGVFLTHLFFSFGVIILSFVFASNSDPTDGGVPDVFGGALATILSLSLTYGIVLIALVVNVIVVIVRKQKNDGKEID